MRKKLFLCSVLILLFANGAFAGDGAYRRTKDGKTLVWDNYPTSGERAEWSGKGDEDGYATGQGTLTWYKPKRSIFTIAERHEVVVADHVSGKMVRGKFEGPVVSVDANGKTTHATFVSGNRTSDWAAGPPPGPSRTGTPKRTSKSVAAATSGATGLPSPGSSESVRERSDATGPIEQNVSPPAKETATPVNDSLRSIAVPPSSLNLSRDASPEASIPPTTSSSPTTGPSLATADVIQLADAEARVNGHVLREYQNPRARYIEVSDTWLVSYDQKPTDGTPKGSKHFNVIVEDKTQKTSIAADR